MKWVLSISFFFFTASSALGQRELRLAELDYGIIAADIEMKEKLPTSPSESHLVMGGIPHFQKKTDSIPASPGTQFAVAYRLEYEKEVVLPITIRWNFPEGMKDAKGRAVHKTEYVLERPVNADLYTSYVLETENELVPGKWTLTILYHNKTLYRRDFYLFSTVFSHQPHK